MAIPTLNFDTLACVKKLEQAGFTTKQAEAQTELLAKFINENLATKQNLDIVKFELKKDIELVRRDIKELEANAKRDIKELETNAKRDIKELEARTKKEIELVRNDIAISKRDIIIKLTAILGSLTVGCFTVLGVMMAFLVR